MKDYKYIYFIGIGGIGMSAIARYYNTRGYIVSGYDRTASRLTDSLIDEGIAIHFEDNTDFIPKDKDNCLVVYTPAIPKSLKELQYVQEHGYKIIKRSAMLGEISRGQDCIAIAGTHGKTSTSTMTAHIFQQSSKACSAFLGGISKNYNSNLLISSNPIVVAEADEFDRSFLQLYPKIASISSMDADHLDIYKDLSNYKSAFKDFASQVQEKLIIKYGLDISEKDTKAEILTYSYKDKRADFYADNIRKDELGHIIYDLHYNSNLIKDIRVGVAGWINAENSIASAALALSYGLKNEEVKQGIESFKGVVRRMDMQVNTTKMSYIDDYAHHPAELNAAISSIKEIFPHRHICGIFQPHLYTRTRDFAEDFASSLSQLDKLILLDIYPAREEPIEGVSSKLIFDKVNIKDKVLISKEELMPYLNNQNIDVIASFGAGDIDRYIEKIKELIITRLTNNE